ncbi:hypothetical protein ACFC63_18230 [Streptomyces albidoflavus]
MTNDIDTTTTDSGAAAPPPDRAEERRAADRELFARLEAAAFAESPELAMLRERLWRYGWNILRGWMREGTIIAKCRENRVYFPAPYTEVEELMHRADVREEIAIDCLGVAVPHFLSYCLPGWKPQGGRNLTSFFTRVALFCFRDAYRNWATGHRRRMREILGDPLVTYDADYDVWELTPPPGLEQQTVLRETLGTILAQASMEERAVCEAILTTGATQEQIAQRLGTTRKSVERRLRRVRDRARELAEAGVIVVPSVSSAVTR